ncbi:DUF6415 family natural product biosynthesis protein [Streptomyces sp. 900105245]
MTAQKSAVDTRPVDIRTMRKTVDLLLPPDVPPASDTLETLVARMRGQLQLVIPEVVAVAVALPKDDVPRYCALACAREARGRLERMAPGPARHDQLVYARRLARSLSALCDYFEALTGVRTCVICDQPIQSGEPSQPYDVAHHGGAAGAGRRHERCVQSAARH